MKFLLVLGLFLTSCASKKDNEEDKPKGPESQIVGRIASVSHTGKFVLIQKYGPGFLPANALYQVRGPDGRSASLRPSGERVRDFFAADLLSGTAQKGDAVMAYITPPEKEGSEDEEAENTEKSGDSEPKVATQKPQDNSPDSKNIKD